MIIFIVSQMVCDNLDHMTNYYEIGTSLCEAIK
jgi:hypothetical protein